MNVNKLFFRQQHLHSSSRRWWINEKGDNIVPFDGQLASHFCVGCQIGGVWKSWFVTLNFDFLMHVTDCANLREIEFMIMLDDDELVDSNVSQCSD